MASVHVIRFQSPPDRAATDSCLQNRLLCMVAMTKLTLTMALEALAAISGQPQEKGIRTQRRGPFGSQGGQPRPHTLQDVDNVPTL